MAYLLDDKQYIKSNKLFTVIELLSLYGGFAGSVFFVFHLIGKQMNRNFLLAKVVENIFFIED